MIVPEDEARQKPTGSPWSESHRLVSIADNGKTAVAMQVSVKISGSRHSASFHCVVFRVNQPPIVIDEAEIVVPKARWEFRTSGLWVDTICETPLQHWSYGLEAFGLEISNPAELLGRGYGDRVPLGWELEFESSPSLVESSPGTDAAPSVDVVSGYAQRGEAHGLFLFATGEFEFVGQAVRQHWWGSAEPSNFASVLAGFDEQINAALGGKAESMETAGAEVALPLAISDGDAVQWWLVGSVAGIRSRTVIL